MPEPGAPATAFGYGSGFNNWLPLVGGDGRGAGGTLELGNGGALLRWCVFSNVGLDCSSAVIEARRVPLPFEKLWLVSFNLDTKLPRWLPDAARRAALEASGVLQYTSDVDVVVKATSLDSAAYRAAKRSLDAARAAKADLEGAARAVQTCTAKVKEARRRRGAADGDAEAAPFDDDDNASARRSMDALVRAQTAYAALKADIRAEGTIQTYLHGKHERAARRRLGLLDERALRHAGRLRLVHIAANDAHSAMSTLPQDVLNAVLAFLGGPVDAGHEPPHLPRPLRGHF